MQRCCRTTQWAFTTARAWENSPDSFFPVHSFKTHVKQTPTARSRQQSGFGFNQRAASKTAIEIIDDTFRRLVLSGTQRSF